MKKLLLIMILLLPTVVHAETKSVSCDASARPKYLPVGSAPVIQTWGQGITGNTSTAPDCVGLNLHNFTLLVALTGSFSSKDSGDTLLIRFGSISSLKGIHYWSVTDNRWDTLITDAAAINGADTDNRRNDFSLEDMKSGKDLYFFENDNRASNKVIYRMHVLKTARDSLEINTANISKIRLFLLPIFDSGDLQSIFILERITPDTWGYYSLSAIREKGVASVGDHQKSYINRATAMYRHFIGVPTDQEPPTAP